jgi:hypothetical protein
MGTLSARKQALDRLSRLLDHPRGTRMPSVAIYGDSGMGKTMIMKRFRDEHPPRFDPATGTLRTPVLAMEIAGIGEASLYAATFAAIVLPIATGWVVFGTSIGRLASRRREMLISRVAAVPLVAFAVMVAGPAIAELFGR